MEWYRRLYSGRQIPHFLPSLLHSQFIDTFVIFGFLAG
ncbi:hypothetical protein D1BOALGB6SA_4889 [Olavius sp. associated proteobacterium Delta 1]|nr:hypothetical protein D1BOALGB6SA_4889 [Olavius sp. associated proteobacterium Delta 1]